MTKIEAIIRPEKLDDVKLALNEFGAKGITVSQVIGCGLQKGHKEVYRGAEYTINLLPKIKIEIVVKDSAAKDIVQVISKSAHTGNIGDGKIFVYSIGNAIRIRTGEEGDSAIS